MSLKQWFERRWVKLAAGIAVAAIVALLLILLAWSTGRTLYAYAFAGMAVLPIAFVLGLSLLRAILSPGHPILGVARTLIDEAIRMKVALVLLAGLALLIPLLPVMITEPRLAYRLTSFLTYSMIATSILLSLVTIYLGCSTIARELSKCQIYLSLTKPIGRGQYLLGKWLGIMLLNLLLISVAGAGIYLFAIVLATNGKPIDGQDAMIVEEEILVSRASIKPTFPGDLEAEVDAGFERAQTEFPAFLQTSEGALTVEQGRAKVRERIIFEWHTIMPGNGRLFRFTGLAAARNMDRPIYLRIKPKSAAGYQQVNVQLSVNGRPALPGGRPLAPMANDAFYKIALNPLAITEQGVLDIAVHNMQGDAAIQLEPGVGIELLYNVGGFEANLAKGLFVLWVRLCCLAMLGLATGAMLSFPVAALVTTMVYIVAAASGFLTESLEWYSAFGFKEDLTTLEKIGLGINELFGKLMDGEILEVIKFVMKWVGTAFLAVVPSFGELDPVPLVSDGRAVPTTMIVRAIWKVGLLWTGVAAVIGWLIFRRRELARVIV